MKKQGKGFSCELNAVFTGADAESQAALGAYPWLHTGSTSDIACLY